ncbi:hypothetical protein ACWDE9_28565 [Streptomyces olivaceoviridis]
MLKSGTAASAPSLGEAPRSSARPTAGPGTGAPRATGSAEDFSDIEAILKKHGI